MAVVVCIHSIHCLLTICNAHTQSVWSEHCTMGKCTSCGQPQKWAFPLYSKVVMVCIHSIHCLLTICNAHIQSVWSGPHYTMGKCTSGGQPQKWAFPLHSMVVMVCIHSIYCLLTICNAHVRSVWSEPHWSLSWSYVILTHYYHQTQSIQQDFHTKFLVANHRTYEYMSTVQLTFWMGIRDKLSKRCNKISQIMVGAWVFWLAL